MASLGYTAASAAAAPAAGSGLSQKVRAVLNWQPGPGLKDILGFTCQLSVMIKAGIDIRSAIEGIASQITKKSFRLIVEQIQHDLESGKSFSEALTRHRNVFSPLYINMVKASELSGNFAAMLERVAAYQTQQVETRNMVVGAMIYPGIIATMAVSCTIFLLTFVLPKFAMVFKGNEHLLPGSTKFLLALSDFLRNYWYIPLAAVAAAAGAFRFWLRTDGGRKTWDRFKLRVPLMKKMFRALYITRGIQTMGELVAAGVPMLDTLRITAEVSGNSLYQAMWMKVHEAVHDGGKIVTVLTSHPLLPRNVVQMIAAGEESGSLAAVLQDVSEYYAKELKSTIKSVTSMMEPVMIVAMGGIVGFIAMSIILPIFKMSSMFK
ncbi:MAG: type II secretion system F family protein [Planctomycetaceae bacterium]|nr:type II secretion system F family protein [Planctomycetaceae bacterium]